MTDLIRVADASKPFDYSILPDDVTVVLGYIGLYGYTPHIWSTHEVQACRDAGKRWFAICTVPQRLLSAGDGRSAAGWCLAKLPEYGYTLDMPVFLDIEYSAYHADPVRADACVRAWRDGLRAAGYLNTWPYLPNSAGYGWLAHWTGTAPAELPDRVAGVQYDHALADDRYDISVFRSTIFPEGNDTMKLDQEALDQVRDLLTQQTNALFAKIHGDLKGTELREVTDLADAEAAKVSLSTLQAGLDELRQAVAGQVQIGPASIPCTLTLHPDGAPTQNGPAPAVNGPESSEPAPGGADAPQSAG